MRVGDFLQGENDSKMPAVNDFVLNTTDEKNF